MEHRIQALETSLATIAAELKALSNLVAAGFTKVNSNFDTIQKEITLFHQQFELLNKKVDLLKGDTDGGFQDVGMKIENLAEEIAKIGTVTNYSEQYSNLKVVK